MQMRPWTPNNDSTSEIRNREPLATDGNGIFLVPCRRRSSMTLITKAEEYAMKTARSELMFSRLKERNGLMKSVLEKLRECLRRLASVKCEYNCKCVDICTQMTDWMEEHPSSSVSAWQRPLRR